MPNRISLKGTPRQEESVAKGTITPGHLVMLDSDNEVLVHGTEGGYAEKSVAIEDVLQGLTISDNYSADDIVTYILNKSGDENYMFLKAGESVAPGDQLISAGDGTLIKLASAASGTVVKQIIAIARDTLDLTASGAVATRLAVRLM